MLSDSFASASSASATISSKTSSSDASLQDNFGLYYVITENGEELANGWETTGEVELDPECAFNDYEEEEL